MATKQEKDFVCGLLKDISDPVIVELGANIGQEQEWISNACKIEPFYIMVEPDPRNLVLIKKRPNTLIISGAIADFDGNSIFYLSDNLDEPILEWSHGSGSLCKPTGHFKRFPRIKFDQTCWVKTFTLDTIFKCEKLNKIDLLWVDIQGAERKMIAGGQNSLHHTRYLFIEAEAEELYEGEALKGELIGMLPDWSLIQDFEYNIVLQNNKFLC